MRILYYLKGTKIFGLYYFFSNDYKLIGYNDSDWSRDMDDRIGFVFYMGDIAFTWVSKNESIFTLSTCKA